MKFVLILRIFTDRVDREGETCINTHWLSSSEVAAAKPVGTLTLNIRRSANLGWWGDH